MVKTKLVGAAGRFGSRYGQHVKRKIAKIESRQRLKQECPFCGRTVKRASKGIWECKKCGKRFAGHAFFIEKGSMNVKPSVKPEKKVKVASPKGVPSKEGKKEKAETKPVKKKVAAKKTTAKTKK